jgi:cytochrome c-type biogenesis protein CcsB
MEELARWAFWAGLLTSAAASMAYAAFALSFAVPVRRLVAQTSAGAVELTERPAPARGLGRAGTYLAVLCFASLSVSLIARGIVAEQVPLRNMYEYSIAFAWAITGFYLAFEARYRQRRVGAFVMPVALAILAIAATFPHENEPLIPALQNKPLLTIHVSTMVLSYSVLAVAFAASVMHLVQGGDGRRFQSLPSGRTLDRIGHMAVLVGFPGLALGIALGAWWANSAWGRYWGWDPKETSALVSWLIFAGYLHARSVPTWRGTRCAWLCVLGFVGILFSYFVVNLWVSGLHSYAGV